MARPRNPRALIAGWFSFDLPHSTAGDLLALKTTVKWATSAGYDCGVAVPHPAAPGEVSSALAKQEDYDIVVFVCGPLTEVHIGPFVRRFPALRKIAVNVSILPDTDISDEFDVIIPRDCADTALPDISMATASEPVPVVGLIYVGKQNEYPGQRHRIIEVIVDRVARELGFAVIRIDTRLPNNAYGLSSISQIESAIRRMDLVITTRLHGAVLSLRNGTPPVAIDPVPGGAKVSKQMRALGWPLTLTVDELTEDRLKQALALASTGEFQRKATSIYESALPTLDDVKARFLDALAT